MASDGQSEAWRSSPRLVCMGCSNFWEVSSMYTAVLMMALTTGVDMPDGRRGGGCHGCRGGCYGGCYGGGGYGGGCCGCYGGGGYGGCYGGGCYGGGGYGGCYGGGGYGG